MESLNIITNKAGCQWEGGTGIDPDGEFCGECSYIHFDVCPRLESKLLNKDIQRCPFCGHIATRQSLRAVQLLHEPYYQAIIGCNSCGGSMIGYGKNPNYAWQDATTKWNTRNRQLKCIR